VADRKILSQINVTPLVDVILVLLIIFMITAPMLEEGIDVALPKVEAGGLPTPREPVIVSINRKGDIYISKMKLTPAELGKKLEAIFSRRTDKMVLLKADAKVPYGTVAEAMAEIRNAGILKIGMVTEPIIRKK
jgi:biopolymer transport protein TolR